MKFSTVESAAKLASSVKLEEKKRGGRPSICPRCGETSADGVCQACRCLEMVFEGNHICETMLPDRTPVQTAQKKKD